MTDKPKNPAAIALGRLGGAARRDKLSTEQRKAISRLGGLARQEKARNSKKDQQQA